MPEIPAALRALLEDFTALGGRDRVQLLIELADSLPPLPQRYVDDPSSLEPVPECQSPIALAVTVEDGVVRLFFDAPPTAPTTSGFAGVLHEGLDGAQVEEVLAVPADLPHRLGLGDAISPLRLNGMTAMLRRVQRQVAEATT